MFEPSQSDVRRFFCDTYAKSKLGKSLTLTPIEALASDWIEQHPEYHEVLSDVSKALATVYTATSAGTNPFLHLSMHLSISEQTSIDQPRGIRRVIEQLGARHSSLHQAHHEAMECLGEMLWVSQRRGLPPDAPAYLEALQRRATR